MPSFMGINAQVLINNTPVKGYGVKLEGRKATCFIEAVDGADSSSPMTAASNGEENADLLARSGSYNVAEGKRISNTEMQPFILGGVQLTDSHAGACSDEQIIKNLGTIKFAIQRVIVLRDARPGSVRLCSGTTASKRLHEQSKKAQLSHATSLGAKRAAVPAQSVRIQAIDTANYIEFTFTYLRRDLLEIRGLVEPLPRQPTPEPLPPSVAGPSRTRNTLAGKTVNADAETMQAEIARLRAENATLKGQGTVKRERERDTEGFSSSKRVKTEKIKSEKGSSKKTPIVIDID